MNDENIDSQSQSFLLKELEDWSGKWQNCSTRLTKRMLCVDLDANIVIFKNVIGVNKPLLSSIFVFEWTFTQQGTKNRKVLTVFL